jgi:uncharacterized protein
MKVADRKLLLALARESILTYFDGKEPSYAKVKHLSQKRGVFVTLEEKGKLRGCIGFPQPLHPLHISVFELARGAAFGDPRFPPVLRSEVSRLTIEISLLTVPKLLSPSRQEDLPKMVKIGQDGLIIAIDESSGLLLPQVAIEHHFTPAQFLDCLAEKAGLPAAAWKDPAAKIYSFQAEIFSEQAK